MGEVETATDLVVAGVENPDDAADNIATMFVVLM